MFMMGVMLELILESLSQEATSPASEPGELLEDHATKADLKGGGGGNQVPKEEKEKELFMASVSTRQTSGTQA